MEQPLAAAGGGERRVAAGRRRAAVGGPALILSAGNFMFIVPEGCPKKNGQATLSLAQASLGPSG